VTTDEWASWVEYHATLHRIADDQDLRMMQLWREVFESRNYTAEELRAASLHLSMTQPKTWRSEHLEFLLEHVAGRRRQEAVAARHAEQGEYSYCALCRGSGLIGGVPHLTDVKSGEWVHPFRRGAVVCRCSKGAGWRSGYEQNVERRRSKNLRPMPPQLTIDEYELRNAGWKMQLEDFEQKRKAEKRAREETREHDRKRGRIGLIGSVVERVVAKVESATVPEVPDECPF